MTITQDIAGLKGPIIGSANAYGLSFFVKDAPVFFRGKYR